MITGLGTGTFFTSLAMPRSIVGVADAEGEFLIDDLGNYLITDQSEFILTNIQILKLVTDTALELVTDTGDNIASYRLEGETTSAPDPE